MNHSMSRKKEVTSDSCLTCNCTLYDVQYVRTLEKKLADIRAVLEDDTLEVPLLENDMNRIRSIINS